MPCFAFRALILLAFMTLFSVCAGPALGQTVDARQDQLERAHLAEAEPRKMDPGMEEEEEEEISQQLDFFAAGVVLAQQAQAGRGARNGADARPAVGLRGQQLPSGG